MKKHLALVVLLLLTSFSVLAQKFDGNYNTISYSQLFDRIAEETDSVFRLSNHIIKYEPRTDSLFSMKMERFNTIPVRKETLTINKSIELNNVQFLTDLVSSGTGLSYLGSINNIKFTQDFTLRSTISITLFDSEFLGNATVSRGINAPLILQYFKERYNNNFSRPGFRVSENKFHKNATFRLFGLEKKDGFDIDLFVQGNTFISTKNNEDKSNEILVYGNETLFFEFSENIFEGKSQVSILDYDNTLKNLSGNDFGNSSIEFDIRGDKTADRFEFNNNIFQGIVSLALDGLNLNSEIDFDQFNGRLIASNGLNNYLLNLQPISTSINVDSLRTAYYNGSRVSQLSYFDDEISLRGLLNTHYKSNYNTRKANAVYVDMKRIEGERLKYEYMADPSFKSFFTWKINQFLKVFSAYGTEPSKAIIFSVYVILAFALVYLFFPNHWDSHGKNRIIDRFSFFLKYMKRDAGMHDVYLEEKQRDILAYDEYKQLLEGSGKDVPKFFQATGLPLYKWAISGTRLTAGFLSRVDVMKGTWSELPQSKRVWKSFLLIMAFLIALTYDIFIKMLNALMLSINTFTTLGFGEIPIKGLPRYLAIIQGFIGWFMLTIFSVSLISQLLN